MTDPADRNRSGELDLDLDQDERDQDELDQGDVRERRATPRGRRRRGGAGLTVISWRDIPAQVTARTEHGQHKVLLHARFQHAIDRAAGVAGLTSTDDYVREWRSAGEPLALPADASGDDVDALLARRVADLEADHPRERLEALVEAGGLDPDAATPPSSPSSSEGTAS